MITSHRALEQVSTEMLQPVAVGGHGPRGEGRKRRFSPVGPTRWQRGRREIGGKATGK